MENLNFAKYYVRVKWATRWRRVAFSKHLIIVISSPTNSTCATAMSSSLSELWDKRGSSRTDTLIRIASSSPKIPFVIASLSGDDENRTWNSQLIFNEWSYQLTIPIIFRTVARNHARNIRCWAQLQAWIRRLRWRLARYVDARSTSTCCPSRSKFNLVTREFFLSPGSSKTNIHVTRLRKYSEGSNDHPNIFLSSISFTIVQKLYSCCWY